MKARAFVAGGSNWLKRDGNGGQMLEWLTPASGASKTDQVGKVRLVREGASHDGP
jgi:hypothetical protein